MSAPCRPSFTPFVRRPKFSPPPRRRPIFVSPSEHSPDSVSFRVSNHTGVSLSSAPPQRPPSKDTVNDTLAPSPPVQRPMRLRDRREAGVAPFKPYDWSEPSPSLSSARELEGRLYRQLQHKRARSSRVVRQQAKSKPASTSTSRLSVQSVVAVANALGFSDRVLHCPLNAWLVVQWSETGLYDVSDRSAANLLRKFLRSAGSWLQRHHEIALRYVWTMERKRANGLHTNILMHLAKSPTTEIRDALVAHLMEQFSFGKRGVHCDIGRGGLNPSQRAGVLRYICKGIDESAGRRGRNAASILGVRASAQGPVTTQRSGTSENIGRAARRQAGWVEQHDLIEVRRILYPPKKKPEESTGGMS